ncbi:hypothetical protein GUITHDRAFT_115874 [Guillardia theta CCMP2712]|uniref:Uncharacterized protein n=2 Tax=Guillardia theta TaxID=55529 RepID=L1IQ05_GUITC|nr:hypothetical protein GUITHDRAFT_115874 [Guillardia theta CCMP2712]EKX37900.1 hypothetical protein GUITHDRAFT_115874 [Guillardia theta CCMP2712]|mmetsp:Transcript_7183/g.24876  ORF Transcript_7183/g.24876 Transcript_7183/m.24876 type:complete len:381 (+) Transcript_7183:197-1339(+)|eukprot:XP_005824880.1 hypothetical protein GUITHDRAFT_115874 [Guillardia theta CCMP2712]
MATCSAFLPFKKLRSVGATDSNEIDISSFCSVPSAAVESTIIDCQEEHGREFARAHNSDAQSSSKSDDDTASCSSPCDSRYFDPYLKNGPSHKSLWLIPTRAGYGDWMEEALAHVQQKPESEPSLRYLSDCSEAASYRSQVESSDDPDECSESPHWKFGRSNVGRSFSDVAPRLVGSKDKTSRSHTENSNAQVQSLICVSRYPKFCIHPTFLQFLPQDAQRALERLDSAVSSSEMKANAKKRMKDLLLLLVRLADANVLTLVKSKNDEENSMLGFAEIHVHELPRFNSDIRLMVQEDKQHCWLVNGKVDIKEPTGPVYEILRQIGIRPVRGMRGPRFSDPGKRDFMYSYRYAYDEGLMNRNRGRLQPGFIGKNQKRQHME